MTDARIDSAAPAADPAGDEPEDGDVEDWDAEDGAEVLPFDAALVGPARSCSTPTPTRRAPPSSTPPNCAPAPTRTAASPTPTTAPATMSPPPPPPSSRSWPPARAWTPSRRAASTATPTRACTSPPRPVARRHYRRGTRRSPLPRLGRRTPRAPADSRR